MLSENLQAEHADRRIHSLLIEKDRNVEDKIYEIRGLITVLRAVFSSEPLISGDQDITDMYFSMTVLKDKFNELTQILGYGIRDNDKEVS